MSGIFSNLDQESAAFAAACISCKDVVRFDSFEALKLATGDKVSATSDNWRNTSVSLSAALLAREGWNLILQGRGKNPIIDLSVTIVDFTGRVVLTCPDGAGKVLIGSCGHMVANCYLGKPSTLIIGDGTTCNGAEIMNHASFVHIGADCMLSKEILLQASDQHGIFDLATGEIINREKRSITIDNRVWVGRRVTVMPKVKIERGAIVGTGSIVTRNIPTCCAVGGNPAKVIRENVSWSRFLDTLDRQAIDFR